MRVVADAMNGSRAWTKRKRALETRLTMCWGSEAGCHREGMTLLAFQR